MARSRSLFEEAGAMRDETDCGGVGGSGSGRGTAVEPDVAWAEVDEADDKDTAKVEAKGTGTIPSVGTVADAA